MVTPQPQRHPTPESELQLRLPLATSPNHQQQIAPSQVWQLLAPAQQQHLFRQMVKACRDLAAASGSEEARDERS